MPYQDPEKQKEFIRAWKKKPYYKEWTKVYSKEQREIMKAQNCCPRCSTPLLEEGTIYCSNCNARENYPVKAMRGIL